MRSKLRTTGTMFKTFPKIFLFEFIYKLILTAIGAPLLTFLINAAMKSAGVSYLTTDRISLLLKNPITWGIALITLFIVAFFSIVELSALIACYANSFEKRRFSAFGAFRIGLKTFVKAFKGTGIFSFFGFMLVMPLAHFTLSSGIFFAPVFPIIREAVDIVGSPVIITLLVLLETIIIFMLASRSYSLHYLVLTDYKFSECNKRSRELLKGKKLRTAAGLILWGIMLVAAVAAVTFIVSFIILLFIKGFSRPEAALISSLKVLNYAGKVLLIIAYIISTPVLVCYLTAGFRKETKGIEKIDVPDIDSRRISKGLRISFAAVLTALSVFLNFSYIQGIYKGNIKFNAGIFSKPQMTAHRGFSYAAPENTLYAFEKAIEIGSDYIELDVQQSADGQLVVMHDTNLERTTDGKGNVSDFTYNELQRLSCGSWFGKSNEFDDARIMLLSDVLELCDGEILLNIEIKKCGDVIDTADKVAELLNEYGMTGSCYVTSFSYKALKEIKSVDPDIKTGLITNISSTVVYSQLKYIDAVSLNYLFVNQNTVSGAHRNGKKVFVWTVNSRDEMERMISIGVDNIITDRPDLAAETIYSYGKGEWVLSLLKSIFGS